jgi:hypothetical protein
MLSSTIRSFSPSLQRRRRPVSTTSRRFKTLSVWLSILTVLNDLHHPAQGGPRRTRTLGITPGSVTISRANSARRFLTPLHGPSTVPSLAARRNSGPSGAAFTNAGKPCSTRCSCSYHVAGFVGLHGAGLGRDGSNAHPPGARPAFATAPFRQPRVAAQPWDPPLGRLGRSPAFWHDDCRRHNEDRNRLLVGEALRAQLRLLADLHRDAGSGVRLSVREDLTIRSNSGLLMGAAQRGKWVETG